MQVPISKTKWECSLSWPQSLLWPQFSSFVLIYWQGGWHMKCLDSWARFLLLWPVQNLRKETTPGKRSAKPYHLSHLHLVQNGSIMASAAPYSHFLLSVFPVHSKRGWSLWGCVTYGSCAGNNNMNMTNINSLDRGLVIPPPFRPLPGISSLLKCFSKSSGPKMRPQL